MYHGMDVGLKILRRCKEVADSIAEDEESSSGQRVLALTEGKRCKRAGWRLTHTLDELDQELIFTRTALAHLRKGSGELETNLRTRLMDRQDELLDLY